ncbi:MAG TPA: hypothetical protein VF244_00490 [Acidimicrobiales bacterium]
MGRVSRPRGLLFVVAVVFAGCSSDDGPDIAAATSSSTSSSVATSTSISTLPASTTVLSPDSTGPTASTTTDTTVAPVPTVPTTATGPPAVAEGGGWRLVVIEPTAGLTVGRTVVVCYTVSGTSREPEVELEVALDGGAPIRVAGSVGKASATVELGDPASGSHDLHIQLIVNSERLDGVAVTLPVTVDPGAAEGGCP